MADSLSEGVHDGGRRVHDGGDGVRDSVHHVVDLVEVDVAEVTLDEGVDWFCLTIGVEQ